MYNNFPTKIHFVDKFSHLIPPKNIITPFLFKCYLRVQLFFIRKCGLDKGIRLIRHNVGGIKGGF